MKPRSRSGDRGLRSLNRIAVPFSPTRPGGGTQRQGALCRDASRHEVATWLAPRRVSVKTSSEARIPSLIPTPANPIPSPFVFVLAAMSW
jgi:hypothetical protein